MTDDQERKRRFLRAKERRVQSEYVSNDRRRAGLERRTREIGWLALFRGADESEVASVVKGCEVLRLFPGEPLLTPGEYNDKIYLVLSGQLSAQLDANGRDDLSILVCPGECVGELSAIDGKSVSALVRALTEVEVLVLDRHLFWNRLMTITGVAHNLLVALAQRMRRSNEILLDRQRRQLEFEHLQQELDVARQLQLGMLPLDRPLFPDREDIDIFGMIEPAAKIGGDLFDAFFISEHRLFFCIGDVSGHGIPAAMFMARVVSLMRLAAIGTAFPSEILAQLNEQLCAGNDANMFVSLFCGFVNTATGSLIYSNAGHPAPVLCRSGVSSRLPIPKGAIVGLMAELRYTDSETTLLPGDILLSFTDGVTEAQSPDGEEFSEDRLAGLVSRYAQLSLERLTGSIREHVSAYTASETLADDCTLLAIRRL